MSLPGAAPVVAQPLNGQNTAANIAAGIPQQAGANLPTQNPNGAFQISGSGAGGVNNGIPASPVKLTANTSNAGASTTQTVPAPVVVNSQAATSYLGNVGQQVGNLQQNQSQQSQATAPVAPPASAGSGSSTPTTPTTSTSGAQPPSDPTDQINAILANLTGTENSANANSNPQEPKDTYTAQEAQAIWGSNTNGLTTNADGSVTASPEALASAGITDANGNATGTTVNGVPTSETLDQQANDIQTQLAQGYQKMNSDLTAIANGTYPLTPSESAMIASSQQQMIQALQMQATANQSYTGAVGASLASTGGLMGAQQMSMMQGAIAIGAQRTADLNSRMTQAIASLQDSFMKEDYTNVQDQWANTSKYFDDRASAISDMQKTIATQVQNMITSAQKDAETQISAIMDSANFGQKSYQDALTQANALVTQGIAQGTLNEKVSNDLATQADNAVKNHIAEATLALAQQKENFTESQSGAGNITGLPVVSMTASGAPDPTTQAQFLATLPPQTAANVKAIADYQVSLSSFPTRLTSGGTGYTQQQMAALVSQYDPTYDSKQYPTRAAMQKNVTSGPYSQTIVAANTLVQHLAELQAAAQALPGFTSGGRNVPLINAGANMLLNAGGSGAVNNFNIIADAVSSEAASIYKNTGSPAASEITNWRSNVNADQSPDGVSKDVTAMLGLMGGKLSTISQEYSSVMGKPATFQILTPQSIKILTSMGLDPSDYDPTYGQSAYSGTSDSDFLGGASGNNMPDTSTTNDPTTFLTNFNPTQ